MDSKCVMVSSAYGFFLQRARLASSVTFGNVYIVQVTLGNRLQFGGEKSNEIHQ